MEIRITAMPVITKKGSDFEVKFEAYNHSPIPITHLEICFTYCNEISNRKKKEKAVLGVDKDSSAYTVLSLKSEHCGNIKITAYSIRCYDILSVGYVSKKCNEWATVSVAPTPHPMAGDIIRKTADMEMEDESIHYQEYKPGSDSSEIFGVRDYKEGDRPNQIHWKLSRKNQRLIMKDYSQPLRDRSLLFIDVGGNEEGEKKLLQTDSCIEAVLSVSDGILKKGHQHMLVWYDWVEKLYAEKDITGNDSSKEALTAFLSAAFYGSDGKEKEDYKLEDELGRNVILITNEVSEDKVVKWQKSGARSLYIVYINDLQKVPLKARTMEFLTRSMVSCYCVDTKNIKETIFKLGIV
ncbi:DUF58 domain-containing protein [Anaerocolumna xylanovorans]|uniref:DUF58 domain-containing protein n=1 Tax=Anaerocolumna xylanovorans TaxID=100134 RepID=UPI001587FB09|nr:DUF58 domain-containing protein [Anaerocolumna xylanovorans]